MRQARGTAPRRAITAVHKITTARDLIQLAGWEVLQTVGEGRSTRYCPNLPGERRVEETQTIPQAPLAPSPFGRGLG